MGRSSRSSRCVAVASTVTVSLALSGCALGLRLPVTPTDTTGVNGATRMTGTTATGNGTSAAPASTDNEVATPPGADERAPVAASARAAVAGFARIYINWDAADLKRRLDWLAADSVGQARSAMALAASQTGADPELAQAGIANRGTVEAVASLGGGAGRYVVVTRESTTATDTSAYDGLAPAWHLTVATVARRGGGWVVSGWQPQS